MFHVWLYQKLMIGIVVVSALLASAIAQQTNPCTTNSIVKDTPFCDLSLPFSERAMYLVTSLLTVEEKVSLLSTDPANGVPRLSIDPYQWWNEALHGVGDSPGVTFDGSTPHATSFPQVIVTGSTFNRTLWSSIGDAISTEAR